MTAQDNQAGMDVLCVSCRRGIRIPPKPIDPSVVVMAISMPPPAAAYPLDIELKSRLAAGLLGVLLGSLGIHRFYLGYTTIGVCQLLLTLVVSIPTCGLSALAAYIWGLVEGIMILTGSINRDFYDRPLKE